MKSTVPRDIFGTRGLIARALPSYEHRPEQERMMEAVEAAVTRCDVALVEAGTGVGKTLAYLVPALLSGRQTVVATGTRALMDQVFGKDVPFLAEVLGEPFRAAILKGRSNYLCLAKLDDEWRNPGLLDVDDHRLVARARKWSKQTASGDLGELNDVPEGHPLLRRIACHAETCPGRPCPAYGECFLFRARAKALEADLVITNHHLLFADLAMGDEGGTLLPAGATLILDEAHGLEDVATEYLGLMATSGHLAELARDAQKLARESDPTTGRRLTSPAGRLEAGFGAVLRGLAPREGRFRIFAGTLEPAVERAWHELDVDLENLGHEAGELARELDRPADLAGRVLAVRTALAEVLTGTEPGLVRIAERRGATSGGLAALPVDVGALLRERLFLTGRPVVLTSATLSVGGSTAFLRSRLGVPEGAAEAVLASPYDFARQVLLYVPEGTPDPNHPGYLDAFVAQVESILAATRGRAFLLFTSHAVLRQAHARLKDRLPWPLLVQGEAPRDELLRRFKARKGSCLFGTATFWEGVDVAGEALSCVIIDRLPFDPPDEPLVRARADAVTLAGGDAFQDYQLPLAVIRLRQGFGRLVRGRTDKGVVAILDPRLRSRPYGATFLRSLPPAPVTAELAEVTAWCRKHLRSRKVAAAAEAEPAES